MRAGLIISRQNVLIASFSYATQQYDVNANNSCIVFSHLPPFHRRPLICIVRLLTFPRLAREYLLSRFDPAPSISGAFLVADARSGPIRNISVILSDSVPLVRGFQAICKRGGCPFPPLFDIHARRRNRGRRNRETR